MASDPYTGTPEGRLYLRDIVKEFDEWRIELKASADVTGNTAIKRRVEIIDATTNLILSLIQHGDRVMPILRGEDRGFAPRWGRR